MKLRVIPSGSLQTNAYLLSAPARGEAVLIDAPGEVWAHVKTALEGDGCTLTELWLTHGHGDHLESAATIVRATGAKVRAHVGDRHFFDSPGIQASLVPEWASLEPVAVDHWVEGGERFSALGLEVEVRHVPGHAPGNVLFSLASAGAAFVGDAIFRRGYGRTDLPGGSDAVLMNSITTQIYTLADRTVLYPGHGPATTVAEEKRENPLVRG